MTISELSLKLETNQTWISYYQTLTMMMMMMIDDEPRSYLNLKSLSVHLDIACLKYVSKVSGNTAHPLARYQPQLRTTAKTHPEGLARPNSRTALS